MLQSKIRISLASRIQEALIARQQQSRYRQLPQITEKEGPVISIGGKSMLNFASNDYLGLSQHSLLKERSIKFIERYGVGSTASRLLSGNHEIYEELETKLARLKRTESALIFPSGFQLNVSVLPALSRLRSNFICDRLCHNSIITGVQLAQKQFLRYQHNDLIDLESKLGKLEGSELSKENCKISSGTWIVTESIFSMDGDLADIVNLDRLAKNNNASLFVDEAHATGIFGQNGMGFTSSLPGIDMTMGTFSKGLGSFGAYVACSSSLRDFLINYCNGFIYTTALSPSILGAIDAALDLVPTLDLERSKLLESSAYLRNTLTTIGFNTGLSKSQIIPILLKNDQQAISLSQFLEENAIFAPAIRPPTVTPDTSRIRISLTALHTPEQIEHLIQVLRSWHDKTNRN